MQVFPFVLILTEKPPSGEEGLQSNSEGEAGGV